MKIDSELLKQLGGIGLDAIKKNLGEAAKNLSVDDLARFGRATELKGEILIRKSFGVVEGVEELEFAVDETIALCEGKAAAVAKATLANTALEFGKAAGGVVLKLVFGAITGL